MWPFKGHPAQLLQQRTIKHVYLAQESVALNHPEEQPGQKLEDSSERCSGAGGVGEGQECWGKNGAIYWKLD